jgi:hypothetical protein
LRIQEGNRNLPLLYASGRILAHHCRLNRLADRRARDQGADAGVIAPGLFRNRILTAAGMPNGRRSRVQRSTLCKAESARRDARTRQGQVLGLHDWTECLEYDYPASGHLYFSTEASQPKPIDQDWAKQCGFNCIANG